MYEPKASEIPERYDPRWVEAMDGRLAVVKAVKARLAVLHSDLGGDLSYQEACLAKRLIWLEAMAEQTERKIAEGEEADVGRYTQSVNAIVGLCRALGLKRRAKDAMDLASYLRQRREQEATPEPEPAA